MDEDISEILRKASNTWAHAAKALDIRVTAPFAISIGSGTFECIAFVHDFGSSNGTIVGVLHPRTFGTDGRLKKYAKQHGIFLSFVNPLGCIKYNESLFKEALEDWGYYGEQGKCPRWFNGFKYGQALP